MSIQPDVPRDLCALVQRGVNGRLFLGAEILIAHRADILVHGAFGTFDGTRPLKPGSIFDVASLTKPVVTAGLLLSLGLPLDSPVSQYIPGFTGGTKGSVTLRHLAAHCSGLPPTRRFIESCTTKQEVAQALLDTPLDHPPGQVVAYSCLGYMVLGHVLERATGQRLDRLFSKQIAGPLGMHDSLFCPLENGAPGARIVPTGNRAHNGGEPGIVNDSNAWMSGGISGNAGLFSTAGDLHKFAQMLLDPASGFNAQVMFEPQGPADQPTRSIGFELNQPDHPASCGADFPSGAAGHTGFTGCSLWMDPAKGLIVILLSNRSAITHRGNLDDMKAFRRAFHRQVAASGLMAQGPGVRPTDDGESAGTLG